MSDSPFQMIPQSLYPSAGWLPPGQNDSQGSQWTFDSTTAQFHASGSTFTNFKLINNYCVIITPNNMKAKYNNAANAQLVQ